MDTARADPADQLHYWITETPDAPAISHPASGTPMTYRQLGARIAAYANGFERIGIGRGVKTIVMVSPDPDLFAVLFALVRVGAVPVVVDPGMGVRRMLHCFRSVGAEGFIGIPKAHLVRLAAFRTFASVRVPVTAGRSWWGGHTLTELARESTETREITHAPDDPMMIAFTTGSTGPAKGVEFTRRGFTAALRVVERLHGRPSGFVSLASVPLFGVFDLLQGAHVILGPVDPVRVSTVDSAEFTDVAARFEVTDITASPALLTPLAKYLTDSGRALPSIRRVISMGAPANLSALAGLRAALGPEARIFTTYGSTEALPLTTLEWSELADTRKATAAGAGSCVGRPLPEADGDTLIRIIRVQDEPIPLWHNELELPLGTVGEIAASGGQVSARYHRNDAADAAHKIDEALPDGSVRRWHRVGDLAWQDESGRLWFAGRAAQRVRTAAGDLYTVQCEQVFNTHPEVARTALVGVGPVGAQLPVLCFELAEGIDPAAERRIQRELWHLAGERELTTRIRVFLRHPGFPTDIRHNAKIGREQLAEWATRLLGHDRVGQPEGIAG